MLDFLKSLWNRKKVKPELTAEGLEETELTTEEFDYQAAIQKKLNDYYANGDWILKRNTYGYSEPKSHKKVILTNPQECAEKLTVWNLSRAWMGTGKCEWEYLLAHWFFQAVNKAVADESTEADISEVFVHDLFDSNKTFSQEQVEEHIMRFFTVIFESENEIRLKLNIA